MTTQTGLTPTEKKRFIRELTKTVTDSIIRNVAEMPAEWDGHELRQYIADKFAWQTSEAMRADRRRMRDYRNAAGRGNL